MLTLENRISFEIQNENIDFISQSFVESPNITNNYYISAFFLDILNCLSYNPTKIIQSVTLLKEITNLCRHRHQDVIAEKCQEILISLCFQITQKDIDIEEKIHCIGFLYKLYENHFFDNFQYIFDSFQEQILNEHEVFKNFQFLFLIWFAPECETMNKVFFDRQIESFFCFAKSSDCSPLFFPIIDQIAILQADNWQILKKLRNMSFSPDLYSTLQSTFPTSGDIIEPSVFIPCSFLQHRPSISMINSFFKSPSFNIDDDQIDFRSMDDADHFFTYFVAASGSVNYIQRLIKKNINIDGTLHIASLFHQNELFDYLYNYFNRQNNFTTDIWNLGTILHQAAISDNTRIFELSFLHEIDLTQLTDGEGKLVLHYAAQHNSVYVLELIENHFFNNQGKVQDDDPLLISFTSFVNSVDDNELTPLMYAALNNSVQAAHYLLHSSRFYKLVINVNSRDVSGRTALHYVAKIGADQIALELLQFEGVNKDPLDNALRLPSHFAAHFGHSSALLILITNGSSIEKRSKNGWTPIKFAIARGSLKCVSLLLNHLELDKNERNDLYHFADNLEQYDIAKLILK